jgi:hypothetical protein
MVAFLFAMTTWSFVDGWMVDELSAAATWSFVDGCQTHPIGYHVTFGRVLSLLVDYHHGFTHPLLATLVWMYFFFGRHSWLVFRGGGPPSPPHVFLLFVCVFRIPPVILGLPMSPCIHVPAFLMALPLNEKRVKDPIEKNCTLKFSSPNLISLGSRGTFTRCRIRTYILHGGVT